LLFDGPLLCGFNVVIKGLINGILTLQFFSSASYGQHCLQREHYIFTYSGLIFVQCQHRIALCGPAALAIGQHAVCAGESIPVPTWNHPQVGKFIPVQMK